MWLYHCVFHKNEHEFLLFHTFAIIWCCPDFPLQPFSQVVFTVLICDSLIMYDVEHLFVCLLAICIQSIMKCPEFSHFLKLGCLFTSGDLRSYQRYCFATPCHNNAFLQDAGLLRDIYFFSPAQIHYSRLCGIIAKMMEVNRSDFGCLELIFTICEILHKFSHLISFVTL